MRNWIIFVPLVLTAAGCTRNDADALGRIGKKLVDRAQAAASPLREKLDHTVKGIGPSGGVKERVQQRLHFDKALADLTIEVNVVDTEVELKGTLKNAEQRRRAVELAETTVGVDRVADRLQME